MRCFRCKEEIEKGQAYFCISEYSEEGKFLRENYVHKICWDRLMTKLTDVSEAQNMIKNLKKRLISLGMLPKEEEEVVRI